MAAAPSLAGLQSIIPSGSATIVEDTAPSTVSTFL
jgi:hypothetical protein